MFVFFSVSTTGFGTGYLTEQLLNCSIDVSMETFYQLYSVNQMISTMLGLNIWLAVCLVHYKVASWCLSTKDGDIATELIEQRFRVLDCNFFFYRLIYS